MSPDEISILLTCDFEKYVSTSKDLHIFPYNVSSFSQVTSPMFDVEKDTESERSLSNFGGAYNNTSDVCAHDDLIVVGGVFKKKFATISMFPHAGDCSEICFDTSDEEENNENNIVDSEFPFYTDKFCNDHPDGKFTKFNVPSNSLLDEDKYCDQQIFDQHFQNNFLDLVIDHLFQCEEFSASGKSNVMNNMTAKR